MLKQWIQNCKKSKDFLVIGGEEVWAYHDLFFSPATAHSSQQLDGRPVLTLAVAHAPHLMTPLEFELWKQQNGCMCVCLSVCLFLCVSLWFLARWAKGSLSLSLSLSLTHTHTHTNTNNWRMICYITEIHSWSQFIPQFVLHSCNKAFLFFHSFAEFCDSLMLGIWQQAEATAKSAEAVQTGRRHSCMVAGAVEWKVVVSKGIINVWWFLLLEGNPLSEACLTPSFPFMIYWKVEISAYLLCLHSTP